MTAIRDVVNGFDQSGELGQVQRELVETLAGEAEAIADNYELEIVRSLRNAGTTEERTVPITAILNSKREVRAFVSASISSIPTEVESSLKSLVPDAADSIINGITTLISGTLTTFLGEASAETGTIEEYYVMTERLTIVRVDLKAWYQNVQATSVREKMERVSAFVAVKSAVDLSRIDFTTFLHLYQQQLNAAKLDQAYVDEALKKAQEIYDAFRNITTGPMPANTPAYSPPSFDVVTVPPASSHLG